MNEPIIKAETIIDTTPSNVRDWFMALEKHPERYQFDTHAGFEFTQGSFGDVGSRFYTQEKFRGVRLTLHFELTDISDRRVEFRLRRPIRTIWGAFVIEAHTANTTNLRLEVGSYTTLGQKLLKLPLIHTTIRQQIQGEVNNIKRSIQHLQEQEGTAHELSQKN